MQHLFESILETINQSDITLLIAPSASGKSISLPKYLSESMSVLVITKSSIHAQYFAQVTNSTFTEILNFKKNLAYTDAKTFWNMLIELFQKGVCKVKTKFPEIIIFDDYDPITLFYFLCLNLLLYCHEQTRGTSILLQSTIEVQIPDYLGKISTFKIPDDSFPTDIRYFNKNFYSQDPTMIKELAKTISDLHSTNLEGDFLAILPKTYEVESLFAKLVNKKIPTIMVTKRSDLKALNELYTDRDHRIVVLTTDLLEPLISLTHIGVLFETMYEKRYEVNIMGGIRDVTTQISKQTLKRYCRRISRNFPGLCYRMFTLDNFEKLNETPKNQWFGFPIWFEISQMKAKGIDAEKVLEPVLDKVKKSFSLLETIGLCSSYLEESCAFANKFPLNPRHSMILFNWVKETKFPLFPCIVAVCLIDCFNSLLFKYPRKEQSENPAKYNLTLQQHRQKFYIKYSGISDLETLLNVWRELMNNVGGLIETPPYAFLQWSKENSFDINRIMEIRILVLKVIDILKDMGYAIEIGPFDNKNVIKELRPYIVKSYKDRIVSKKDSSNYYYDSNGGKYKVDGKHSVNLLNSANYKSVINLLSFEVKMEEKINIISFAVDL